MNVRRILDFIKEKGWIIAYSTLYLMVQIYVYGVAVALVCALILGILFLEATTISLCFALLLGINNLIVSIYVEYEDYIQRK